jgi:hypothetical protein
MPKAGKKRGEASSLPDIMVQPELDEVAYHSFSRRIEIGIIQSSIKQAYCEKLGLKLSNSVPC